MHELGIAREVIQRVIDVVARENERATVTAVDLELGPDGKYQTEALTFSLRAAAKDTCAENAEFRIAATEAGGVTLRGVEIEEPD